MQIFVLFVINFLWGDKLLNLTTIHHCDHMTSENPEKCQHSDYHRSSSFKWTFCGFLCFFWIQPKWNGKRLSVVGFSHDVALQRSFFRTLFVPPPPTAVTFELITHTHRDAHKRTRVHAHGHTAFFVGIFGHHLSVKTWLSCSHFHTEFPQRRPTFLLLLNVCIDQANFSGL